MAGELVLRTLKHVWSTLEPLHLPMALTGGLALSVWKHVRATRDVDLVIDLGTTEADTVLSLLLAAGLHVRRFPPVRPLAPFRLIQLSYSPPGSFVDVDVDLLISDADYPREALARRIAGRLPEWDFDLSVLQCEDVILHKLISSRLIDRVDVATLLRLNRPSLNLGYLLSHVGSLKLTGEFGEAWREAFPDEQVPMAADATRV
jgi:hypothetical protein